jgi:NHLM bacteriocin system ABC transporter ATP-binding protein
MTEIATPLDANGKSDGLSRTLARIERSGEETRLRLARSLRQLEDVDEGRHSAGVSVAWGAAAKAVYRLIGTSLDADAGRAAPLAGGDLDDVPAACRVFGGLCRRIVLSPAWWREDLGLLAGRLEDGDGRGNVVALRPKARGGYIAVDPETGTEVAVTLDLAKRISPNAFVIVPALPHEAGDFFGLARFLWPSLKPDLPRVLLLGALMSLIGLLVPIATGLVIDEFIPSGETGLLFQVGAGLAATALLTTALGIIQRFGLLRLEGRSAVVLRAAVWKRVMALPATFFKQYSSGDLGQRIGGIEAMRHALMSVILNATVTALFSCVYLALLFSYDTRLALVSMAIVLVLALVTIAAGLVQIKHHKRQAILSGWLSGYVFQVLQGIIKLRVAGAEDRAFTRWAQKYADERSAIMTARRISTHYAAFSDAYSILALAALYATLGYLGGLGLSPGTFVAFLAAFGAFQAAFLGLSGAFLQIVAVLPDFERARPVLEAKPEKALSAADPGPLIGKIEVSKVTFSYAAGATPVLKDVSISVNPGEHVAIVGPSGSGKSTLLRILLGLETPQYGTVLYDGQDLAGLDVTAVRRQIGIVLQTGRVFAGTIIENIRGATNASLEDCLAACEAAGFAGDLETFPMGLHTPLTEGAATISGGQRQRLLIARALVAKPKILFFDEATSALDNRTQAIVTESLDRLTVTRIVIAHRLSTVRNAGKIIVMDKGTVVETGSYENLMAAGGLFSELAKKQLI